MSHWKMAGVVLLMLASGVAAADVNVSREAISNHLSEHVNISNSQLASTLSEQEMEEFNKHVRQRIATLAVEMLPESFNLPERDALEILPSLSLPFADGELADLYIRRLMMEVQMHANIARQFSEPDEALVAGISSDLKYFVDGIRERMTARLVPVIEAEVINPIMAQKEEELGRQIVSRKGYVMKARVSKQVMDEMLSAFDNTLSQAVKELPAQLTESKGSDADEEIKHMGLKQKQIHEMIRSPLHQFAKAATDTEIESKWPEMIPPGARELMDKVREREGVLIAEVQAQKSLDSKTQYYQKVHLDPALDESMSNLTVERIKTVEPSPTSPTTQTSQTIKTSKPDTVNPQDAPHSQPVSISSVNARVPAEDSMFREYGWALALAGIVGGVAAGLVVRMRKNAAAR